MGDSDMRWINTIALVPVAAVLTAVLARLSDPPGRRAQAHGLSAERRTD
jgi:hypothetical protein